MINAKEVAGIILFIFCFAQQVLAQNNPTITATKITNNEYILVDGYLTEEIWFKTEVVTNFTQSTPSDGKPASEKTEIRVLYSEDYLYVGAIAFDSSPDSVMANLFRRDGSESSDWIYVNIDSYNDDRTAFTFAANPLGIQKDIMYYDDTSEDVLWDAIWEAKTKILDDGWSVEFKIPFSQLRFTSNTDVQNWGINFQRRIARKGEISFWARTPRQESGLVSKFGDLLGLRNIDPPTRLEITPYISSNIIRDDVGTQENPFYQQYENENKIGGDIKYGISSDFTLTATINPDFGQIEADPATINLTEYELYFEERRPFFKEGGEIFNFGGTTSRNSFRTHINFYSRRIGRTPYAKDQYLGIIEHEGKSLSLDYSSKNQFTTIAGAAKISGKTKNGLSVGILNAYTLDEKIDFFDQLRDTIGVISAEPASNYFAGRIRQDLSKVDAQIGGFFSAVNRNFSDDYLSNYMHTSAYQGGMDAQYYWKDRNWGVSGVVNVSSVNGTKEAILRTQQTSARYFNRIDSKQLRVDSSLTNLTGYFAEFSIGKYSGSGLRYSFTYSEMSPEYEINDMGFLERSDYRAPHYQIEYLNVDSELFRFYWLWADVGHAWNFDGDMIFNYYSASGYFQLNNLWTIYASLGLTGRFYMDRIARGGPTMLRPKDWNVFLKITTDTSEKLYADFSTSYRSDASGEYYVTFDAGMNLRPFSNVLLSFGPGYNKSLDNDQYQGYSDQNGDNISDYVFSSIDLDIIYAELRANVTFTPRISLQTYLRPYYYNADFDDYKVFKEVKTYNFEPLEPTLNDRYDNEYDSEFYSLQGNAVLRWEYRPGSTLFFVWQQDRSDFNSGEVQFEPFQGFINTFRNDPINIFLLKFSYWFGG